MITVETTIQLPLEKVWELWTLPVHIIHWNFASEEWHCPQAINDLQSGGILFWRMEAKDGSMGFDFSGTYDHIQPQENINFTLDDDRKVSVEFISLGKRTKVIEHFEPENQNSLALQRSGWQSILDNFKRYAENRESASI
ncbi:MAG: SRPBCC family protein [Cyclobacteriaceae bacterium]